MIKVGRLVLLYKLDLYRKSDGKRQAEEEEEVEKEEKEEGKENSTFQSVSLIRDQNPPRCNRCVPGPDLMEFPQPKSHIRGPSRQHTES